MDEKLIRSVVEEVLGRLATQGAASPKAATPVVRRFGVYADANAAVEAAHAGYLQLRRLGVAGREKIIQIVKRMCAAKADEWGRIEFDETRIGRLEHKIAKLHGIQNLPGTEWLAPLGMSGDHGIAMEENCPFGVIAAITPVTHSVPTLACNIVTMVAAGNAVVFNAHPKGARCAAMAVRSFNEAIHRELGIESIATIIETPSVESFNALCAHELVKLICVTGGPGIVSAAMKSGKRAVCAGPGNPPVVVDETADLNKAARDIILGGAFDNNLLCIGEKQVFVVDKVYGAFLEAFRQAGARQLNSSQLERLTAAAFTFKADGGGCSHPVLNRDLVGADAAVLARHAGLDVPAECVMLFAETDAKHAFVVEEQMMPMLPIVRVKDIDEAIEQARISEHGYKHSSIIHSYDVRRMSAMAKVLETTLFVKNGPCVAGLGMGGEGYLSFSIATTTGEGITTPDTFTRRRRCVMVDHLSML